MSKQRITVLVVVIFSISAVVLCYLYLELRKKSIHSLLHQAEYSVGSDFRLNEESAQDLAARAMQDIGFNSFPNTAPATQDAQSVSWIIDFRFDSKDHNSMIGDCLLLKGEKQQARYFIHLELKDRVVKCKVVRAL